MNRPILNLVRRCFLSLGIVSIVSVIASTSASAADNADQVAKRLRAAYPATRIDAVTAAPVDGIYEVVMGHNVAYTDASGAYFLFGHIVAMASQTDLTQIRVEGLERVDTTLLPEVSSITTTRGTGSRVLYVFADANCGYCKRLERTLETLGDATIHVVPVSYLSHDSGPKASAALCATDQVSAWRHVLLEGASAAGVDACDQKVARNTEIGHKLHVEGTPTLITPDGRRLSGAHDLQTIVAWLDQSTTAAPKVAAGDPSAQSAQAQAAHH